MYMYIITLVKEQRKKYFNREVVFENEKSVTVVRLWVMSFFFLFLRWICLLKRQDGRKA